MIVMTFVAWWNMSPAWAQSSVGGIAVYPANSTIEVNSTRQFTAYVPISPNTVTWSVNDIIGGNDTVGKIDAAGLYKAPATAPASNIVTIKARSTAQSTAYGSVNLTITRLYPYLWSVNPTSIPVGTYQVSLNGANYAADSQVLVNGTPITTTYVSSTKLIATGNAPTVGTISFSVRQPGNGAVTGNSVTAQVVAAQVKVAVSPTASSVELGKSQSFSSAVTGATNTGVTWSIIGGTGDQGSISASGVYIAPQTMPPSTTVAIRATSVVSPSSYAQAAIMLTSPPPPPVVVTVAPGSVSVELEKTLSFTATVTGSSNTSVTWLVVGGVSNGTIDAAGVYTAPSTMPASNKVTVRATSAAKSTSMAQAVITLTAPPPSLVSLHDARFLEQSSFGPTPATLAEVKQKGIETYLEEQFLKTETQIPTPPTNDMGLLRQWCLYNYTSAPDQLRQRVAYSLSQILVTSSNKLIYPDAMLPWLRLLSQHAFGNYRDLLRDMTKSPSMGKYLDLAYSSKPMGASGANENYPRELMQLFTIGLWKLKDNGDYETDAEGYLIPTYDQATVAQMALALTGWVYAPGPPNSSSGVEYFGAPMIAVPSRHDTSQKQILGKTLPAGQSAEQDLESVLDALMTHPNIAPFIATRLIRSLVKSNPSPAYIQRVASVFADNGNQVVGDLKSVVTAILLDPEARNDVPSATDGRLKEPILQVANFLRALDGHFTSSQQVTYLFDYMGQGVLSPPSVFSWYSPLYRIPGSPTFGPEFQIYSPTEATLRGNMIFSALYQPGGDVVIDLTPFQAYGNDVPGLVEAVNQKLLYGRMPAGMKQALITAASPGYDAKARIETVLYLTALSGLYSVQH